MDKIVILTSVHTAFDVRIFHKQAISLAKAGYNVTLIAQHDKDEKVDGVRIVSLPKSSNRLQRMTKLVFRILRLALREKAKVYHFHDPELIPVGLLLKLLGAKVIYDVHEDCPADIRTKCWLSPFTANIIAYVFNIFEKICSCFFDAIITATEDISKRFRSSKVVIIHNYPILHYFAEKVSTKLYRKYCTIIYIGGLAKNRGIGEIVKSLEYIDERLQVKMKLLGEFTETYFEKELRAIEAFSRVDFVGLVPYKDVISHLSSADIGLVLIHPLPHFMKSMPIKLFEYMSAGLPVIASNFPLWKEIIEGNNCGLTVDPMKPREIAEAIEYLLKRPELMEEMGKNGQMAVLEKYNWEQESNKLLNLMTKLTEE